MSNVELCEAINEAYYDAFRKKPRKGDRNTLIKIIKRYVELEFIRITFQPLQQSFDNGNLLRFIGFDAMR